MKTRFKGQSNRTVGNLKQKAGTWNTNKEEQQKNVAIQIPYPASEKPVFWRL